MLNRLETMEIINAVDKKNVKKEKLSFLSTESTFTVYKKNRLVRLTLDEIEKLVVENGPLLSATRSEYDLVAEFLLNKLHKTKKPFPDVKELQEK